MVACQPMKTLDFRCILIAALVFLLCACARQTELLKLYEDSSIGERQYERIFVVGIAGDSETRRRLEDLISEDLGRAGVDAVSAYTITGTKTVLLQDEIDAAARKSGSDAIIITHIVSVDTRAERQAGRSDIVAECRRGDPADYFLYDYKELKEPDTVRLAHTVVAVTNLYETAEGRRMWTIQSTCFKKETMNEALIAEAEAITRQLQIDNLIR